MALLEFWPSLDLRSDSLALTGAPRRRSFERLRRANRSV